MKHSHLAQKKNPEDSVNIVNSYTADHYSKTLIWTAWLDVLLIGKKSPQE